MNLAVQRDDPPGTGSIGVVARAARSGAGAEVRIVRAAARFIVVIASRGSRPRTVTSPRWLVAPLKFVDTAGQIGVITGRKDCAAQPVEQLRCQCRATCTAETDVAGADEHSRRACQAGCRLRDDCRGRVEGRRIPSATGQRSCSEKEEESADVLRNTAHLLPRESPFGRGENESAPAREQTSSSAGETYADELSVCSNTRGAAGKSKEKIGSRIPRSLLANGALRQLVLRVLHLRDFAAHER